MAWTSYLYIYIELYQRHLKHVQSERFHHKTKTDDIRLA